MKRRLWSVLAVLFVVGASASLGSAAHASPQPDSILWGGWIGKQLTGREAPWDWNAVNGFQSAIGTSKRPSLIQFASPFVSDGDCGGPCRFDATAFGNIAWHNAYALFSWSTGSLPASVLLSGAYDQYVRAWAVAAKHYQRWILLRFDWESNGTWFPWANWTPEEYKAVWQRFRGIFRSVGADNVDWAYCPTADPNHTLQDMALDYPGDDVVDWVCLDTYNTAHPGDTFLETVGPDYDYLQSLSGGKPFAIAEFAASNQAGDKAAWIDEAMWRIDEGSLPKLHALAYFDKAEEGPSGDSDWTIEDDPAAAADFGWWINTRPYVAG